MNIAFDVDGTLIDEDGQPRKEVLRILSALACGHHRIYIWSGGGLEYARQRVRELDIGEYVTDCIVKARTEWMDLVFDDQEVELGRNNIKV